MRLLAVAVLSSLVTACASSPRATPPAAAPRDTARPPAAPTPGAAAGSGSGAAPVALSPRDSLQTAVGGAMVSVNYGRPSMRGRKIFGEVVPFGKVWRAGANAATAFVTSKDLVIGGYDVPAGSYTLYAIPVQTVASPCAGGSRASAQGGTAGQAWQLVINKQTGQWGTEYNPDQDLIRIPMKVSTLGAPVEQFEIKVTPRDDGTGLLSLAWETTKAEVGVRVK